MLDHDTGPESDRATVVRSGPWRVIAPLAATGFALLVLGLGLGLALIGRHGGGAIQGWDRTVWQWSIQHRGPLVGLDKVISTLGDAGLLGPICVIVTLVALAVLRSPVALTPIIGYLGGEGLVYLIRAIIHRPRPLTANYPAHGALPGVHETSYSFPSGHSVAVTAVLFAVLGALAIARHWWWPWLAALAVSAFVADSRLLLGVHWFSDVTIGLALGIAWGTTVAVILARCTWTDLGLRRAAQESSPTPGGVRD